MLIRKLKTHSEFLAAERLQRTVWRFPWREVIPLNELVVAQRIGGHVIGAFEGRRLIGFSFGIPGLEARRPYFYSRMTGILPACQNSGAGRRLKAFQRQLVLEQGLDLIRWTFDPLQSRNAFFNIEKLGVVIDEYLPNLYGESESRFNRGLPTDRFVSRWWIRSRRVEDRLSGRSPSPTIEEALFGLPAALDVAAAGTWLRPHRVRSPLRDPRITVEIPANIDALKADDLRLALAWRGAIRRAFQSYFSRGYAVTGFARGEGRSLYLLEKTR